MTRICAIGLVLAATLLGGCTTETEYGRCKGVVSDRDPNLVYETSLQNAALAVFFSETIIVPVIVLADETVCPVARRAPPSHP